MLDPSPGRNNQDITLLLVEDDEVDVRVFQDCLKQVGFTNRIMLAEDGLDAIEMLKSGEVPWPWVILADLGLPRMGGFSFLAQLRNEPALKHSTVFVISSSVIDRDVAKAYDYHVAGYLCKEHMGPPFLNRLRMLKDFIAEIVLPEAPGTT